MNKKFLSAVLFGALMVGSSVTFTGCVDNDEPAGIENLRGAKAELLRAKVAVEAAEAALKNAYAAEHLAQAKWTEAMATNQELLNESQRLKNEIEAAKTEQKKAYWAAELARVEAELEKNKLDWEADRLAAATVLAQAQKDYEDAMKAIELSKNYLSEEELGQLNFVQGEYSYAYAKLYSGAYTRYTASYDKTTGKVTWKPEKGSVEKGAKDKLSDAYGQYATEVDNGDFSSISEIKLNAAVAEAKADLDGSMAELGIKKEALAALESSETLANWKKVKAEYKAKQDSLNDVVADKTIAANKIVIENSDKAMAMQKALNDAAGFKTDTFKDGKIVQEEKDNAEIEVSEALKTKLGDLDFNEAGPYVTYDKVANKFAVALNTAKLLGVARDNKTNGTATLEKAKLDAEEEGKAPYEYWNENGVKLLDDAIVFNGGKDSEYAKMNKAIDAVIEILNKEKGEIPSLDVEQANKELAAAKENLTAKEKTKTDATKSWKDAITTWEKAKAYTTEKADKDAVVKAADAYVKAIAAAEQIADNTEKVKAQIKARQAFADAVVKYYNAVNAGPGLSSNTVTLELNKTVGTGKEWITKTVLAWLSDANNRDGYLESLLSYFNLTEATMGADALKVFWTEGEKETVTAGEKPSVNATAALKKINKVDDVRKILLDASKALYGDIQSLGFYVVNDVEYGRETEPSDAEIKAQWEKTPAQVGACGDVLSAEKRVKTAEESVAQVDQFAAVVKALEEVKATIAKAKLDFMAEAETLIKAAKDAQTACVDNINAPIQKLGIDADKALNDKIGNVIDAVEGSIGAFGTKLEDDELKQTAKYIALIQSLKNEISGLQETTIPTNEEALTKAEAMLDAYKNGNMSAQHVIEWAQSKLDNVKIAYDSAVSELTYWTEKLKEVTTALYSKSSAE